MKKIRKNKWNKSVEEEKIKRIQSWLEKKPLGPIELRLYLTDVCNLKCKFCSHGMMKHVFNYSNEMKLQEWLRILVELKKIGCNKVDVNGGEPFTRKADTLKIMNKIKELDMNGSLTTNGTLLNKEDVKKIFEMQWDSIQISIDSAKKEIHDNLRGVKGSFEKAEETLKNINYWKKKCTGKKPDVFLAMVLTNKNYKDIKETLKLAVKYKCEEFNITPMVEQFESAKKLQITDKQIPKLKEILENAKKLSQKLKIKTNLKEIKKNYDIIIKKDKYSKIVKKTGKKQEQLPICFEPWLVIRIDPHGWVSCCTSNTNLRSINIKNTSVIKAWKHKDFDDIRKKIISRKPIKACEICCFAVFADNLQLMKKINKQVPGLFSNHT